MEGTTRAAAIRSDLASLAPILQGNLDPVVVTYFSWAAQPLNQMSAIDFLDTDELPYDCVIGACAASMMLIQVLCHFFDTFLALGELSRITSTIGTRVPAGRHGHASVTRWRSTPASR